MAKPSNIETLYQIEDSIVAAASTLLSGSGLPVVNSQRETEIFTWPRVELEVTLGGPSQHVFISGSTSYYDTFTANVSAVVITDRAIRESAVSHSIYVSQLISCLSDKHQFNTASLLPYHSVIQSNFDHNTITIKEDNQDLTACGFTYLVQINRDAWL